MENSGRYGDNHFTRIKQLANACKTVGAVSVVGLFSGIGGFELGFSAAGFETKLLVEIDPASRAVLESHFTTAAVHEDVEDLVDIPRHTTIVTAGFPCQNLSMAGDKSGISGPQSGVVKKMFKLIERSQVPIVVIENVYFLLQLKSGRGMEWLVQQFEELGYYWAYRVLDTMGFGLPQRRRRVYLVASRDLDPRSVLFADETCRGVSPRADLTSPIGFYWTEGRSGIGLTIDGIPPLKVGSALGIPSAPAVLFPDGEVQMPSLGAAEMLQGFPLGWTAPAGCGHGRRSPEWRMVGNAVSVPVARWVAERIKVPGPILDFVRAPMRAGQRWPDGGWNVGAGRVAIEAGDMPIAMTNPSISAFRDSNWTRLSDRALNGFVKRAAEGGLRMPVGFLDALRNAHRKSLYSV